MRRHARWARAAIGVVLLMIPAAAARATAFPGPDGFGYEGIALQGSILRDVRATGAEEVLGDDEVTAPIPLGFTFSFYGVDYTEAVISSNGFLSFDPNSGHLCCAGVPLPDPNFPQPLIAAFWGDLDPGISGQIFHETRGTAGTREFIAGFYGVSQHDTLGAATVTFEIVLHEGTGDIEILHGSSSASVDAAEVGIQNEDGTVGLDILNTAPFDDGDLIFEDQGFLITTNGLPTCAGRTVTILGGSAASVLIGTAGDDVIIAGDGPDVVLGGDGDDVICGGNGDDSLDGGPGNDVILGGNGNDTIRGSAGNDRLNGGRGADVCHGGAGRDRARSCEIEQRVE